MSNDMSQTVPPKAAPNGENPRRRALVFAVVAFALIAMLAALPFLASRPRPAPDFAMTTLAGEAKTLETLAGRPVLVSFWSTDCGPCMNEMPSLIAVHRRYAREGLVTLAVAMPYDRRDEIARVVRSQGMPFDIVHDADGSLARMFDDTQNTPTKFLIDPSGQIIKIYVGSTHFPDLIERLEAMLST
jgi:peroxiredoxin